MWHWRVMKSDQVAGLAMTLYSMLGLRRREQIRVMLASWRAAPQLPRLKTHCVHGHLLSIENLCRWNKQRRCRLCHNARTARQKALKRNGSAQEFSI